MGGLTLFSMHRNCVDSELLIECLARRDRATQPRVRFPFRHGKRRCRTSRHNIHKPMLPMCPQSQYIGTRNKRRVPCYKTPKVRWQTKWGWARHYLQPPTMHDHPYELDRSIRRRIVLSLPVPLAIQGHYASSTTPEFYRTYTIPIRGVRKVSTLAMEDLCP